MACLAQLLANHRCILVLDAASQRVQIGMLQAGNPPLWHTTADEAGRGIFAGTDALLQQAGLTMEEIDAFLFCEGPGSLLGTRTVAMALRTWLVLKPWSPLAPPEAGKPRPVYRYQSLRLQAHNLRRTDLSTPFSVIADARRDTWHCVTSDRAGIHALRRATTAEIAASDGELYQPAAFRAWAPPPRPTLDCAYDVAKLLAEHDEADLFTETDGPDAFQHEAPEYKRWSAQPHSSATARNEPIVKTDKRSS